jgi:hypothetical protein
LAQRYSQFVKPFKYTQEDGTAEAIRSERMTHSLDQFGCATKAEIPRALRKELATLARKLARDHRALFASDPIYRKRAGSF